MMKMDITTIGVSVRSMTTMMILPIHLDLLWVAYEWVKQKHLKN